MARQREKKILVFANLADPHMIRFVRQLEDQNHSGLDFYFFGGDYSNVLKNGALDVYKRGYFVKSHFPRLLYSLAIVKNILLVLDLIISFFPLLRVRFDCINIHCFDIRAFILFPILKVISKTILISPWGSDVYRISKIRRFFFKYTGYRFSDYVATSGKFKEDIKSIFMVPERKFIELYFGSDLITIIQSNINLAKRRSKELIGAGESYVIVCGYNANPAQNHHQIIDSLIQVKDQLPLSTYLVFPMTYGPEIPNYVESIEQKLSDHNFQYQILKTYLPLDSLYHYVNSTDVMIHMQKSDAFSSAIKEYLLCDTKVINGSWLRYPNLEFAGVPYHLVDDFKTLPSSIIEIIYKRNIIIPQELKHYLWQFSWANSIKKWISTFRDI